MIQMIEVWKRIQRKMWMILMMKIEMKLLTERRMMTLLRKLQMLQML